MFVTDVLQFLLRTFVARVAALGLRDVISDTIHPPSCDVSVVCDLFACHQSFASSASLGDFATRVAVRANSDPPSMQMLISCEITLHISPGSSPVLSIPLKGLSCLPREGLRKFPRRLERTIHAETGRYLGAIWTMLRVNGRPRVALLCVR